MVNISVLTVLLDSSDEILHNDLCSLHLASQPWSEEEQCHQPVLHTDRHAVYVFVESLRPGAAGARLGRPHFFPKSPVGETWTKGPSEPVCPYPWLLMTKKGVGV